MKPQFDAQLKLQANGLIILNAALKCATPSVWLWLLLFLIICATPSERSAPAFEWNDVYGTFKNAFKIVRSFSSRVLAFEYFNRRTKRDGAMTGALALPWGCCCCWRWSCLVVGWTVFPLYVWFFVFWPDTISFLTRVQPAERSSLFLVVGFA